MEDFCQKHDLPLKIVDLGLQDLAIPEVKQAISRPICSVCGKIKRYFFNHIAQEGNFDALATGHNLDDEVARLLSNTLRWDKAYLADQGPLLPAETGFTRKVKPLWRLTEFETANYAFLRNIPHHSTACPYSQGASFSTLKNWFHKLDEKMPGRKLDFYQGFLSRGREAFAALAKNEGEILRPCSRCGYPTSGQNACGICNIRKAVSKYREEHAQNRLQ